jgi:hypothetical protein
MINILYAQCRLFRNCVSILPLMLTIYTSYVLPCQASPTDSSKIPQTYSSQNVIFLKGGAPIQGKILSITSESVTLLTGRGELIISLRNLEDASRLKLEKKLSDDKKIQDDLPPKEKSRLVSKLLEEREILNQQSEGDAPRLKFGRKEFVYRKYTHRGGGIDYIFTPVGQNQVYDSDETLRLTYNGSTASPQERLIMVQDLTASLGGPMTVSPTSPNSFEFHGTIKGENGNPSRVILGRLFNYNSKTQTIVYTRFGKEKNYEETKSWLKRNQERLQVSLRNMEEFPAKEELDKYQKKTNPHTSKSKNKNAEDSIVKSKELPQSEPKELDQEGDQKEDQELNQELDQELDQEPTQEVKKE